MTWQRPGNTCLERWRTQPPSGESLRVTTSFYLTCTVDPQSLNSPCFQISPSANCPFPNCRWQGTLSTSALPLIIVSHVQTGFWEGDVWFCHVRVLSNSSESIQQKWFLNTSESRLSSYFLLEGLNYHVDLSCMYILSLSYDRWLVSGHICSCILPHKKSLQWIGQFLQGLGFSFCLDLFLCWRRNLEK